MTFLQTGSTEISQSTDFLNPSPTCVRRGSALNSARNSNRSVPNRFLAAAARMSSLRTSLFRRLKAGMTVEASIVLPLFLFFFMNIAGSLEMIRLHGNLQLALWKAGGELAVYGYAVDQGMQPEEGEEEGGWWKRLSGAVFSSVFVKARLEELAGKEYLDNSPLKDGADSLMLWESRLFGEGDTIDLVVTYSVAPWSRLTGFSSFRMANRYYAHIWNGYAIPEKPQDTEIVFVAETGQVYHVNRECTHLRLSVRQIKAGELKDARNQYGRGYTFCEKCVRGEKTGGIYVTDEGDKYHYNRDCPGLKRTVRSMSKEEAQKKYRPCSRCSES